MDKVATVIRWVMIVWQEEQSLAWVEEQALERF
jgi:hypothetical protein